MKKYLFFFFLMVGAFCHAQTYRIQYVNYNDTLSPIVKRGTIIQHQQDRSVAFYFLDASEKIGEKKLPPKPGESTNSAIIQAIDTLKILIYKNFSSDQLAFLNPRGLGFKEEEIYTDSLHNFNWNLLQDTARINSVFCRKAVCTWRGRNYVAWYAPSIPISNGPWKFGGLPGLIIEVYDTDGVSYWKMNRLTYSDAIVPAFPEKFAGDFEAFKEKFRQNFLRRKTVIESKNNSEDPSCVGCKSSVTITINTPEKLVGDY